MKKFTAYSSPICLTFFLTFVLLISCNRSQGQQKTFNSETEEFDLELPAMYTGTLPCADCPGLHYQLIIEENQFTEVSRYQDRSPGKFKETGTWKIYGDTLTLIGLENLILRRFLIEEENLTLLNLNNQRMTDNLADMYVLERTGNQESIREHHQKLAEQGFTFFAAGNEPFWSLKIDSLNQVIFETPDSSKNLGEANLPTIEDKVIFVASTNSTQLAFQVHDEYCQDSMSGYLFPQTVTATLQSSKVDTLRGCGLFLDN